MVYLGLKSYFMDCTKYRTAITGFKVSNMTGMFLESHAGFHFKNILIRIPQKILKVL